MVCHAHEIGVGVCMCQAEAARAGVGGGGGDRALHDGMSEGIAAERAARTQRAAMQRTVSWRAAGGAARQVRGEVSGLPINHMDPPRYEFAAGPSLARASRATS